SLPFVADQVLEQLQANPTADNNAAVDSDVQQPTDAAQPTKHNPGEVNVNPKVESANVKPQATSARTLGAFRTALRQGKRGQHDYGQRQMSKAVQMSRGLPVNVRHTSSASARNRLLQRLNLVPGPETESAAAAERWLSVAALTLAAGVRGWLDRSRRQCDWEN